jgi:hypothetical protein
LGDAEALCDLCHAAALRHRGGELKRAEIKTSIGHTG